MRPDLFRAACSLLWGTPEDHWGVGGAMAFLPCNRRNALNFMHGAKEVGPEFEARIIEEVGRRLRSYRTLPVFEVIQQALADGGFPFPVVVT